MTNLELLEFCKRHPEPFSDPYYSKQARQLAISRENDRPNNLQKANAIIRRNITALEALLDKDETVAINNLVAEIVQALQENGINNSEFTSYWEVNDVSFSIYKKLLESERHRFVFEMAKRFIQDRHTIYSSYGYTDTTLQVKADSFAHKRSGGQGSAKVLDILEAVGVPLLMSGNLESFLRSESSVVLSDSKGKYVFDGFVKSKELNFLWGPSHENKRPDFLIKLRDAFWIIEHKHMKEFGGGQNKQINEIIDFIGQSEKLPHIHYVSFLDGILFNRIFLHEGDQKVEAQRNRVINNLQINPYNYFVNTAGFIRLINPNGTPITPRVRDNATDFLLDEKRLSDCCQDDLL